MLAVYREQHGFVVRASARKAPRQFLRTQVRTTNMRIAIRPGADWSFDDTVLVRGS
jgi:hypothetical protein